MLCSSAVLTVRASKGGSNLALFRVAGSMFAAAASGCRACATHLCQHLLSALAFAASLPDVCVQSLLQREKEEKALHFAADLRA